MVDHHPYSSSSSLSLPHRLVAARPKARAGAGARTKCGVRAMAKAGARGGAGTRGEAGARGEARAGPGASAVFCRQRLY